MFPRPRCAGHHTRRARKEFYSPCQSVRVREEAKVSEGEQPEKSIEPVQPRVRTVGRLVFTYRVGASTSCATRQATSFSIALHGGTPLSVPFVSGASRCHLTPWKSR